MTFTAALDKGAINAEGHGVPQDYAEAAKWYRKAADQGLAAAQGNLGAMYAEGNRMQSRARLAIGPRGSAS